MTPAAIAEAARRLVELRERWVNPPELVEWVEEAVAGYPRRLAPRGESAAKELGKRTLTSLSEQPTVRKRSPVGICGFGDHVSVMCIWCCERDVHSRWVLNARDRAEV